MNEIQHDADLIVRGKLCGCAACRQEVTSIPIVPNKREKIIKKKLNRLMFREAAPPTRRYRVGDDGERHEVT